MNDFRDLIEL
jgi:hypothetical protein